jgi:hypothetical protein
MADAEPPPWAEEIVKALMVEHGSQLEPIQSLYTPATQALIIAHALANAGYKVVPA